MRFRSLMLERYGRFEDCTLPFRDGGADGHPDLHIVYGANEAGKSTTMAAVSDLLFGFGARTPYNFRFDNALLRIGAEVEDGETTLACRRRKGNSATLVDAGDQPIDEGALLAMLRGQTRDTFRLAFSLDQEGLRRGGRAMVEAKDDVGQALFAAGSGLTAVAGELDRLTEAADAIWGKRAKASRAFTMAEREWTDSQRRMRDLGLKPKAWTDARAELDRSTAELAALEAQRDALLAEQRGVERLRRIAPALRRREELLAAIEAHGDTVVLSLQREASALAALAAADTAQRERLAATALLVEADARADALETNEALLAHAAAIDDLGERRGAIAKAATDHARLTIEHRVKDARIADLHRELGGATERVPSRLVVSRLRDLARRHAEALSEARAIETNVADLVAREQPLRDRLADTTLSETLPLLVAAIATATRLGDDPDARCAAADRTAERAAAIAEASLTRLAPWSGTHAALLRLATVADDEIEAAQAEQAGFASRIEQDVATATRLGEDLAALALERAALADQDGAVSAEMLGEARQMRDAQWHAIRDHVRDRAALPDPVGSSDAFERAMTGADALADRRFTLAEASGRLVELDARDATLRLQADQARDRLAEARTGLGDAERRWLDRLLAADLPLLSPIRLRAWRADRMAAIEAQATADAARDAADAERGRRDDARQTLATALAGEPGGSATAIAPLLARAIVLRQDAEARDQAFRDDRAELRQIETSLEGQRRRLAQARIEAETARAAWVAELADTGLSLAIDFAEARLAVFEELRGEIDAAAQLAARLHGIDVDAERFAGDIAAITASLGMATDTDPLATVGALRARLEAARLVERALAEIAVDRERRQREIDAAVAAHTAAMHSLAPLLAETGIVAGDSVSMAIADAVEASRTLRGVLAERAEIERDVTAAGDGYPLPDLIAAWQAQDPDLAAGRAATLASDIAELNARVSRAATTSGDAGRIFVALEGEPGAAADAAADAEQARAEMAVQAEAYLLKRTQAVMLRWAMERYRERRQDPLLLRASQLFAMLTLGRYVQLRIDMDGAVPRLGGLRDDGQTLVEVGAMSEGTTDQLFLALRLAAVEQSAAAGVRLPFLADDLFVNFDDARAEAGFRVLADLARTTQVLFFTHHPHLAAIARDVVGAAVHSECRLD